MQAGMLQGVRILDFTRVLAGPYCTAMLADLGAEVIKIEPPAGDDQRYMGRMVQGESANFVLNNRGKQSLRLDLKHPDGQQLAQRLAQVCDVVVENFKPGVAGRLGIGYTQLSALNPKLVYCSISGFGQQGVNAGRPSYDVVAQAMSGIMSVTGEPGGAPTMVGESIGDICAGLYASWAIMAAMFSRERTGSGRYIDVAMLDSLIAIQPTALSQFLFGGKVPARVGNRHPMSSPFGAYEARDGHLVIAAANDKLFHAVALLIGAPDLCTDPRFVTDTSRSQHDHELRVHIERWSKTQRVVDAVDALTRAGVPAAPIQDIAQAIEGSHVVADVTHPVLGASQVMRQPVQFSGMPQTDASPAPMLGQHTDDVLARVLGLSSDAITQLHRDNVV
ncbi:CaiB/BaiF CoA transferase family protein [Pandoraea norimbergensis]|uniref:Acyl-CoA transferase n=1 Tax=Pandoraea norimbergensis TaxID=93219 RepID=A0ABN4JS98_9BURK|nr:CoA transferase [Pandoraea norimbergensis]ALS62918.1 acyl-CoA transferase [Pandoraea norimbergensis]